MLILDVLVFPHDYQGALGKSSAHALDESDDLGPRLTDRAYTQSSPPWVTSGGNAFGSVNLDPHYDDI